MAKPLLSFFIFRFLQSRTFSINLEKLHFVAEVNDSEKESHLLCDFFSYFPFRNLSNFTRLDQKLPKFVKPSRRERNTRSISEIVTPSSYWAPAGSIGLNTNIFEINLINLVLVLGILFYYGKGVCASRTSKWDN